MHPSPPLVLVGRRSSKTNYFLIVPLLQVSPLTSKEEIDILPIRFVFLSGGFNKTDFKKFFPSISLTRLVYREVFEVLFVPLYSLPASVTIMKTPSCLTPPVFHVAIFGFFTLLFLSSHRRVLQLKPLLFRLLSYMFMPLWS